MKNILKTIVLALTAASISTASAQTLFYGPAGQGQATGTWDNGVTADWSTTIAGSPTVWTNNDLAVFGGTSGAVTVAAGGVTADGLTFNTAGYSFSGGTITLAVPAGSTTTSVVVNANTTMGSVLSSTAGDYFTSGYTQSGTGTLTLTARPTIVGPINLTGGTTLQLGNNTATNVANNGNLITLSGGSTLIYDDNIEESETTALRGTGNVIYEGDGGAYLNINGNATNTGTTTVNLTAGGSTSGNIYDNTLFVNGAAGFSANATLNALSGVVDFRSSDTVAGLTGTGGFLATDQTATLTSKTAAGQTYTYSGTIGASTLPGTVGFTTNNLGFAVSGAGTQVLSGAETYTGGTYIQGGMLDLTGSLASTGALTSNGINGVFNYDGTGASAARTQSLGALNFNAGEGTVEETLGSAPSVALTVSSESRAAGAAANFNTVGGVNGTTVETVITGEAAGFMDQGTFFGLGTATGTYADYDSTGYVRGFNYATDAGGSVVAGGTTLGATTAASHVETTGAITAQTTATVGTVQIAGANNITINAGQTLTTSGVLKSGNNAAQISGGTLSGGANELVLGANQSGDTLTVASTIDSTSTGGVTEAGPGTVILTGANSYTGTTSVAGGTLQIGNGTSGSLASGYAGNFNDGGTIVYDLAAPSTTYSGIVSGAGGINQMANTLILSGVNTYSGTTTVAAGATLQFGNGTTSSAAVNLTGAMTVGAGGTIIFNDNNGAGNLGAPISGAGNVTFEGQATGYYQVGNNNGNGPGTQSNQTGLDNTLTITGTTTIDMVQGTTFTGVVFAGPGGLSANSVINFISGDIDMRGSNTVAGLTGGNATGGIDTDGARGTALPTLTDNTAMGTSYTYSGGIGSLPGNTYDVATAAPIAFVKSGAGTQILTGAVNYAGGTTVNGGTLISAGANTTTGATTVSGGGTFLVDKGGNAGTGSATATAITATGASSSSLATVGGNGTINGVTINANGVLAPGDANDAFGTTNKLALTTTGNILMNTGSTLAFTLNGPTAGTQYSQIDFSGGGSGLSLTNVNLQLSLNYTPVVNTTFLLTSGSLATLGNFSELNGMADALGDGSTFTLDGDTFLISYEGGAGGSDLALTVESVTSAPEPSVMALMMVGGLVGLFLIRRRRLV